MFLWLMSLALLFLAVGATLDAALPRWGLFNILDWPHWVQALLSLLFLDFAAWVQHFISHKAPLLWRLHRVHHVDVDFDVPTSIWFHPVEIALSMLMKTGVVYLLGPIAWAIMLFEVLLNGTALFNHAEISLLAKFKSALRFTIVTPTMYFIQYSVPREEHDSNIRFSVSVWDHIFGTHRGETATPSVTWLQSQDDRPTEFSKTLWLPFMRT